VKSMNVEEVGGCRGAGGECCVHVLPSAHPNVASFISKMTLYRNVNCMEWAKDLPHLSKHAGAPLKYIGGVACALN